MHTTRVLGLILVAVMVFGVLLTGCEKNADDAIAAAEKAFNEAEAVGADMHSAKKYDQARNLIAEAKTLNEQGAFKAARSKAELAEIRAKAALGDAQRMEDAATRE